MSKIDIGTKIDLDDLIESRMLIQANSGGGKSGIARVMMEEIYGKLPFIVLDKKGEYYPLKEKFGDIIVIGGSHADISLSMQAAPKLAKFIVSNKLTTIIDMSSLESNEQRSLFLRDFLKGLMNLPEEFWTPYPIFLEEAHVFCGQQDKMPSGKYVKELMSEGRKMGFCGILITQRISKLHKDAAAECNNKFIGRTFLDLDIARSASEMGLTGQDKFKLRDLKPRHFWAFGTSIEPHHVHEVVIKNAQTKFPKGGAKIDFTPKKVTDKIKQALIKLNELPKEATKELNDIKTLQAENKRLESLLNQTKSSKGLSPNDAALKAEIAELKNKLQIEKNCYAALVKIVQQRNDSLNKAAKAILAIPEIDIPRRPAITEKPISIPQATAKTYTPSTPIYNNGSNGTVSGGAMRMLKAAAMFHPEKITKTRMAAIARLSHSSGSFSTYLSTLKRDGLLIGEGNVFTITEEGLRKAGDVDPLPTDPQELVNLWCGIIGDNGGAARILRTLANNYPSEMTRQNVAESAGMSSTSGSFSTYLSTLKRNGLITISGQSIKASEDLFL
jgi:uncharacterized protein